MIIKSGQHHHNSTFGVMSLDQRVTSDIVARIDSLIFRTASPGCLGRVEFVELDDDGDWTKDRLVLRDSAPTVVTRSEVVLL